MVESVELRHPRRLHPISPVVAVLDRNLLAPGIIAFGTGGSRILAGAVALVGLVQVLIWWRQTFVLDGGVLQVTSGVFARNSQLVPCDRIQQVNLVQKLRHRLLGVASLRVEVAGGGRGSGVSLDVLGLDQATSLRDLLLEAKVEATGEITHVADGVEEAGAAPGSEGASTTWVPVPWPVVHLTNRELAVAGLTGRELFVLLAVAGSLFQLAGDVPGALPVLEDVEGIDPGAAGPVVSVFVGLVFVAVWLGSAVTASLVRDAGYALDLVGDELHLRRGLLDRKEAVLPLARVQAVQITASPLRRALGLVSLQVRSASSTESEERRVSVPILPLARLPAVLELLLPGSNALPPLDPAPAAARRRAVTRAVLPASALAVTVSVAAAPTGLLALALVPAALWFGVLNHRGLGHALAPDHLASRTGAIVRRTVVVPLVKAQSARERASVLQRRLGLATCHVDVAGPGRQPVVVDVDGASAARIARRVVAAVAGR